MATLKVGDRVETVEDLNGGWGPSVFVPKGSRGTVDNVSSSFGDDVIFDKIGSLTRYTIKRINEKYLKKIP